MPLSARSLNSADQQVKHRVLHLAMVRAESEFLQIAIAELMCVPRTDALNSRQKLSTWST